MSLVVVARDYGGPEVLDVVDEDVPEPGPGQVQVEVRAAGVNPVDVKRYGGAFGRDPAALPMRLGAEIAGVVRAIGPGVVEPGADPVNPIAVGDEVIGYPVSGGYAQLVNVPANALVHRPPTVSWEQAAGLLLVGATAVHALTATGVKAGDTVLVHGGTGGVGLMAVQLGVHAGARVVATASAGNHELLRELGAEPVEYGPGLAERVRAVAPQGIDAAIDTVGTDEAVDVSVELVADRQRIATIAGFARGAQAGIRLLGGGPGADPGSDIRAAARTDLTRLAGTGRVRVLLAATYPLSEVAQAHRVQAGRHPVGKIVLIP